MIVAPALKLILSLLRSAAATTVAVSVLTATLGTDLATTRPFVEARLLRTGSSFLIFHLFLLFDVLSFLSTLADFAPSLISFFFRPYIPVPSLSRSFLSTAPATPTSMPSVPASRTSSRSLSRTRSARTRPGSTAEASLRSCLPSSQRRSSTPIEDFGARLSSRSSTRVRQATRRRVISSTGISSSVSREEASAQGARARTSKLNFLLRPSRSRARQGAV